MAYGSNGHKGQHHARVSEFKLKEQMCDIGRRIWLKGFCAGNEGNHSYRHWRESRPLHADGNQQGQSQAR